ncbi:DNA processing protein [Clostridium saccharoperbutylacetonicum]|jgi:DNA processing protein|uniref:DNA protecting protein DprA n=2 Tax=Clostridiaceae TaxID=31979 RepID=M1LQD7_9CLOT|nr:MULTISPECIES: DNA-processing protein DprA [Clostridium]AGF55095.1 DNA protecting protein DprA [Clostridium saccharoperbutylacetonicum N1-4(HMT)]NRT64196.1 DNA processing protein [Clostridium saccharoperbutylacetonicum]NSB27563.1 DNA processing protein [Clostridium saccharoperbutylacetonicum]NSB41052.1 DNA processing protein [Clostridium saccharoperbutylacetonicum]
MMDYDLWLILIEISNYQKIKLIKKYKTAENVYNNFENILKENEVVRKKLKNFQKEDLNYAVLKLKEVIAREKINYITYANPLYTEKLSGILSAPFFLFYKGNIDVINNKSIGVVGARKCSSYGIAVTKLLTKELITNNITLISGGARGVDSIAHKTALENDGYNICVLGCGIDIAYPTENKVLFSKIAEKGVVISEFLPGTRPLRENFPKRNRIISGLSSGVVVTEASEKSGSLITARLTLQQQKTVAVVPGSILYAGSSGSNKLIRDGASICTDKEDLKSLLSLEHIDIGPMNFTPEKSEILDLITDSPIHIDDIFKNTSVDRGALYALLFEMQIKSEIICLPGNYYVKTI